MVSQLHKLLTSLRYSEAKPTNLSERESDSPRIPALSSRHRIAKVCPTVCNVRALTHCRHTIKQTYVRAIVSPFKQPKNNSGTWTKDSLCAIYEAYNGSQMLLRCLAMCGSKEVD